MCGKFDPPMAPPEPNYSHSDHSYPVEPDGYDFDGVGRKEAEKLDGEPLLAIREAWHCRREGCDAMATKVSLFSTRSLSDDLVRAIEAERKSWLDVKGAPLTSDPERLGEFVHMNAEIVDYVGDCRRTDRASRTERDARKDEHPIIGIVEDGDTFGYVEPEAVITDGWGGTCHGRPHPPDPEPEWRDI